MYDIISPCVCLQRFECLSAQGLIVRVEANLDHVEQCLLPPLTVFPCMIETAESFRGFVLVPAYVCPTWTPSQEELSTYMQQVMACLQHSTALLFTPQIWGRSILGMLPSPCSQMITMRYIHVGELRNGLSST